MILPGVHQASSAQESIFAKDVWASFDPATQKLIEAAAKMNVLKVWMKFNNDDTVALGKLKAEGAEFITVDASYIAAAKKATREWEDKTAAADPSGSSACSSTSVRSSSSGSPRKTTAPS